MEGGDWACGVATRVGGSSAAGRETSPARGAPPYQRTALERGRIGESHQRLAGGRTFLAGRDEIVSDGPAILLSRAGETANKSWRNSASRQWAAFLEDRQGQVFLLLTLLIGSVVGLACQV